MLDHYPIIQKKIFLIDILRNENPDIVLLSETFLLEDDKFYAKGYRTFKTRNIIRGKGCGILINKNLMVSVLTLRNDSEGRYIKITLKSPNSAIPITISSVYLEPDGDLNAINPEIFDADILGGDLNDAPTNLTRYGVYHLKRINFVKSININKKISDHGILIGQVKATILKNERFTLIEINDKKKTIENEIIMKEGVFKGNIELINPKKTLKIDNYAMNIQNMEIYEDFDKLKELINNEYKEKYNRVEKIIRTGTIDKEGWYKINKLFEEAKKKFTLKIIFQMI